MPYAPNEDELRKARQEGVVIPRDLPPGTVIYVTTPAQCFELTVLEDSIVSIIGTGKRALKKQEAEFVGSIDNNGIIFADWIVRERHLIFKLKTGRYTTGCILTACVKTDLFTYELWESVPE